MADESRSVEILIDFIAKTQGADAAAQAMTKLKAETGDSSHEMHKHTGEAREMHHAFHELNRIIPGLGNAMKAAFHPENIGIIGMVAALEAVVKLIEFMKKASEEAAAAAKKAAEEQKAAIEDQVNDWKIATKASQEYNKQVNDLFRAMAKNSQDATASINLQIEAWKVLNELTGQGKEEQLKVEAAGKAALAAEAQRKVEEAEMAAANVKALKEAEQSVPLRIAQLRQEINDLKKNLEEFPIAQFPKQALVPQSIAAKELEIEQQQGRLAELRKRSIEAAKTIGEGEGVSIPAARQAAAIAGLKADPLGGVVASAAEALRVLAAHGGNIKLLNEQQAAAIKELTTYLQATGQNNWAQLGAIRSAANNLDRLNAEVQKIRQQLDAQARGGGNR